MALDRIYRPHLTRGVERVVGPELNSVCAHAEQHGVRVGDRLKVLPETRSEQGVGQRGDPLPDPVAISLIIRVQPHVRVAQALEAYSELGT